MNKMIKLDYKEMSVRLGRRLAAEASIKKYGGLKEAIDFHATKCRAHFEILAELLSFESE